MLRGENRTSTGESMKQVAITVLACLAAGSPAAADCLSDFKALNAVKAEAGPFRIEMQVSVVPPAASGQKPEPVPVNTITTLVLPLGSYRMTKTGKGQPIDLVVIDRQKAWSKQPDGWKPVEAEKMPDLTGAWPTAEYVATVKLFNLQCLGEQPYKDKPALAFGFDTAPQNNASHVTAYFDPATRLPLGSEVVTEAGPKAIVDAVYVFDSTISVSTPVP